MRKTKKAPPQPEFDMTLVKRMALELPGKMFNYRDQQMLNCIKTKVLIGGRLVISTISKTMVLYGDEVKLIEVINPKTKDVDPVVLRLKWLDVMIPPRKRDWSLRKHWEWTEEEDQILMSKLRGTLKVTVKEIADRIDRSVASVHMRITNLRKRTNGITVPKAITTETVETVNSGFPDESFIM